jgi:hypothetical protein
MRGAAHDATAPTDWETLCAIARWLRPCFATSPAEPIAAAQPWESIIGIASRHMVAPALGSVWAERRDLPPEVAQLFGGLLELNRERNASLMASIGSLLVELNREGIVPVLLKGSAMLADEIYRDPGMRVVLDCDMLIATPSLERASQILKAEGYVPCGTNKAYPGHYHLPPLKNCENGLVVELHHRPIHRRWGGIINSRDCFERGVTIEVGGGRALVPHINDRVAHNIAHTQLADERFRSGYPHLRQLLDVAAFRQRHEATIDWRDIADRFRHARRLHVLTDNLALVEALLGKPAPVMLSCDTEKAQRRVRSALSRAPLARAIKSVQWTITDAARLFVTEPRYLGIWISNALERRSLIGGMRRRARAG